MNLKRKIYLTLGISGLLSVLLMILAILPLFNEIKENSEDFILKRGELTFLETEIKNLEKFEKQYQDYQQNLEKINSLFINPEVPIDFIRFLEKLASDSKISVRISLSPAPKVETQPWPSLFFQLSGVSSFSNFSKFLEKLENSPYLIEVQNLIIRRLTEDELRRKEFEGLSTGDIDASLLIKVYTK